MANIRKRGQSQWQAQIRRRGWPAETKTFTTLFDAKSWAREIESEIDRGVFVSRAEAENTTLDEALDRYEREISASKKGHEQEKFRIRAWKDYKLAKRTLANLKQGDLAKYRDERLAAGVAPATVRLDLAVISHLYTIADKEWGIHIPNPVKRIRMPSVANARDRRLVGDEEKRLLAALEAPAGDRSNPWIQPLVILALETAMRQGELLALEWRNVDLKKRVAHLPETKNGTARDIPLSSRAARVLSAISRSISGKVFPTTESALKQSWSRTVARARRQYVDEMMARGTSKKDVAADSLLLDLHFHDLRHEATSRLAERLAMHELMKVTGHKDTRMLARYYHPRAEDLAKKLG